MDHPLSAAVLSKGYEGLRDAAAWIDVSSRGRLRITGEDRARLLHAMSTNQVQALKPGQGCYVFFLNAQGRILGDANLFCFADHFLLDTEPETRTKLAEHLDRYIIADDVTVEDITDTTAAVAVEGPQAAAALYALNAGIFLEPSALERSGLEQSGLEQSGLEQYGWAAWGTRTIARVDTTGSGGFSIFAPIKEKASLLAQLAGIPEATAGDARTVRIEHGRPRYGEEITERYLVQETGQLRAVNFNKGCYLGQEIVERIRSRAQIHRVLCRLEIDTTEVPAPGAKLKGSEKAAEAAAGEIVSAACSPALGKVVAMAYVRIPYNEPETELSLGEVPARVLPSV
jgi:folate-binding protein YgfZ